MAELRLLAWPIQFPVPILQRGDSVIMDHPGDVRILVRAGLRDVAPGHNAPDDFWRGAMQHSRGDTDSGCMTTATALAALGMVMLAATADAAAAPIACPAQLPAEAQAGFERIGPPGSGDALHRVGLVAGPPGNEAERAPALLAPDRGRQQGERHVSRWELAGYGPVLLVCRYQGTSAYLRIVLPEALKVCVQTLTRQSVAMRCR
ncbi:STY0301 family protein [Falsiroseomonas selenitidurans]|uniref:Uncharacterized protein n=1 Tax=Falsiroseomonas selenitidurans TaxID=2716335 RepID=A0ABX1E6L0_9PROT|nr:STY0301 family protein [Falsiroseomonas selenitidurans]NKC32824.1 hypothetical protein [Falsiroseomonas selenitidurans]